MASSGAKERSQVQGVPVVAFVEMLEIYHEMVVTYVSKWMTSGGCNDEDGLAKGRIG